MPHPRIHPVTMLHVNQALRPVKTGQLLSVLALSPVQFLLRDEFYLLSLVPRIRLH